MDNPSNLIDDHLDGELTDDGLRQLGGWLRERDEHVREFATQWLIHSLVHDYINQRQVQADALLRALTTTRGESRTATLPDALTTSAARARQVTPAQDDRPSRWSMLDRMARLRYRFVGVAAVMLVTLAVGTLAYLATRPKVVAMLTQTANCRWEKSNEAIADGALFREGDELRLAEGRALITFVSGARVVIEGPAAVTVESQSAAALSSGALTATVPAQAIGFTVSAPRARLVDLGTEYTVRTYPDGALELQVFDGMVELKLLDPNHEFDDAPLQITEGTAVKVGANSRNVQATAYDANQRMTLP